MESYLINREGKKVFYRVQGEGKPLVLIHGIMVDADFFDLSAQYLSHYYKVITYDRRGYSRSEACDSYNLEHQSNDLEDIINTLADGKAIIVGCSAGAIISLYFTSRHTEMVEHVYVHEPPLICFDGSTTEEEQKWLTEINEYRVAGKYRKGLHHFMSGISSINYDERTRPYSFEKIDMQLKNGLVFIKDEYEEEFLNTKEIYHFDTLKEFGKITCLVGDSSPNSYTVNATKELAKFLNKDVFYIPGRHNSAHDMPKEFSASILGLLFLGDYYE